ncbi:splicing factor, suppressor of white-apricot homolog [Anneissia japonica]|uniref:splicing factor, suppressor of white-apricot homolog n=1 Tax=Anneissia japonica TaxID=1529436 RepID=UPI001425703C|nr:splicing factor, suppressor of white-apricot homolog [Anneissia japonica]
MALISRKAKLKRAQIYDQKQREKERAREEEEGELLVFGYAAKLFKDDKKATEIDRGEHLIPWMGDKNFQIDRYDGRGHLHDLSEFDKDSWNIIHKLSEEELRIEAVCDEERYLALNTDLFEEKHRHEEEIKRLNEAIAASETTYSAISFNYDESKTNQSDTYDPMQPTQDEAEIETREIEEKETVKLPSNVVQEEPFIAPQELKIPMDMEVPATVKMHAFIERTANFISSRGAQMEIRIKANQAGNSQFDFLNFDHYLNPYYKHLLKLIKSGHYRPKVDQQRPQNKSLTKEGNDVCNIRNTGNDDSGHHSEDDDEDDHDHSGYLHPSLVSNPRPKPTSISAIHQPSSQPVSDTARLPPIPSNVHPTMYEMPAGYHDVASLLAQGYDPAALVAAGYLPVMGSFIPPPPPPPTANSDHGSQIQPYMSVPQGTSFAPPPPPPAPPPPSVSNVTLTHTELTTSIITSPAIYPPPSVSGVSGTSSPSAIPSGADNSNIIPPTPDIQPIIDKMAKYVAKNGEEFEATVRAKNDGRFEFLLPWHSFFTYYKYKKNVYLEEFKKGDENEDDKPKKAPISFSIKAKDSEEKLLDRPSALPYESSESDEENEQKELKTKRVNLLQGKMMPCVPVLDDPAIKPMVIDQQDEVLSRHTEKEKLEKAELRQAEANKVMARQKIADKLAQAARGKLQQSSKERNVQMERRKKAALFLTMIKDKQVTMVPEGILDQVSSTKETSKRSLSPKPRRFSNHSRSVSPVRSQSPSTTYKMSKSRETSPVRKKKRSRSRSPIKRPKSPSSRSHKVAFNKHTKKDKVNNRSRSPSPIRSVRRSSPFRRSGSVGSSVISKSKARSKSPTFSMQTSTTIKCTSPTIPQLQTAANPTPTPPMPPQTFTAEASSQSETTEKTNKLREKIRAMLAMTRDIGIKNDS